MRSAAGWNEAGRGALPGLLGLEALEAGEGTVSARWEVRPDRLAPNGYLHAATVVAPADAGCGFGCVDALPEGAVGFTTVELKSNHLSTVATGGIAGRATLAHGGRTTQVWDAVVTAEATGRTLALFRCTQTVLWPR